ncbi:MAG: DUF167 domain-containing protein [Candidatus Colwellbacteria bacterium]|nr:DUF167 domain-containing protein [Candidatus Colwellbacteria bacterium]
MRIFVKAKPNAKETRIEKLDENRFAVAVKEPPIGGRANVAIEKVIAEHFKVPVSRVRIVSGHTSRQKVFEITGELFC